MSTAWAAIIIAWVALIAVGRRTAYRRRYRALEDVARDTASLAEKAVRLLSDAVPPKPVPSVNVEFTDTPEWARALSSHFIIAPPASQMRVCTSSGGSRRASLPSGFLDSSRHVVFDVDGVFSGDGSVPAGTGDWIQRHMYANPSGKLEATWDELRSEITVHGPTPAARRVLVEKYPSADVDCWQGDSVPVLEQRRA